LQCLPLFLVCCLAPLAYLGCKSVCTCPNQLGMPVACSPGQVVARLEAVLSQKRFTQLGGLQLEKDVRLLVGEPQPLGLWLGRCGIQGMHSDQPTWSEAPREATTS
jgi:hypothetical protein